ncbi:hypothetical protein D917_02151, partial [Trichinella nativa]
MKLIRSNKRIGYRITIPAPYTVIKRNQRRRFYVAMKIEKKLEPTTGPTVSVENYLVRTQSSAINRELTHNKQLRTTVKHCCTNNKGTVLQRITDDHLIVW